MFYAYFGVLVIGSGLNSRNLGPSIVAAISVAGVYPDVTQGGWIIALWVVAVVVAGFRE